MGSAERAVIMMRAFLCILLFVVNTPLGFLSTNEAFSIRGIDSKSGNHDMAVSSLFVWAFSLFDLSLVIRRPKVVAHQNAMKPYGTDPTTVQLHYLTSSSPVQARITEPSSD